MGGEVCYQKDKEKGPWFEIKSIEDIIISKESKGLDASYERSLLGAWSKVKGYEGAREALNRTLKMSKKKGVKMK